MTEAPKPLPHFKGIDRYHPLGLQSGGLQSEQDRSKGRRPVQEVT